MPLTLNVGIAKKLGQSDFGSLGAHCNLSVELAPAVLQGDADALQRHVRHAYAACTCTAGPAGGKRVVWISAR